MPINFTAIPMVWWFLLQRTQAYDIDSAVMRKRVYLLMLLWVGVCLPACGVKKQNDVWDIYDVRHPLPSGSQVPDKYARQYDNYIDNDEYYIRPKCAALDSPACLSGQ